MTSHAVSTEGAAPGHGDLVLEAEFTAIFHAYVRAVCRVLSLVGVPQAHADDAAQEVFLVVHEKLPLLERRGDLRGYVLGVAYRVGHNFRRKYRNGSVPWSEGVHEPSLPAFPSVASLEAGQLVERFVHSLDDGMRDVFVMALLEERPAPEVAALLGVSVNTVSSRIRLLRQAFRKVIQGPEGVLP